MPGWPDWADALVEQTRSGRSDAAWERAEAIVRDGTLTAEQADFLATLGLAELASCADMLDRDAARPCAGASVARSRYAGMRGYLREHARSWAPAPDPEA